MEGANISVTSRAMLGNIFTLFQSLLSLRWAMFTTFKYLSRRSILEIVTSGVMFDHMGDVRQYLHSIPVPFEPLLGHVYDVQVPISGSILEITKGSLVRTTLSLLCEAKGLA